MSEYISLADLQVLPDEELSRRWEHGLFPFEMVKSCGNCITMHRPSYAFGCHVHPAFRAAAGFIPNYKSLAPPILRSLLEGIYSLRLFYRDLYASNPPELDDIPAPELPVSVGVSR